MLPLTAVSQPQPHDGKVNIMGKIITVVCVAWILGLAANGGQEASKPPQPKSMEGKTGQADGVEFLIFLPKGYDTDTDKRWPLMLFLHGGGGRGTNIAQVTSLGPPKLAKEGRDFPFIIVAPQCRPGKRWDNKLLLPLLDNIEKDYRVDTTRVYLTGLSLGGLGTWNLGLAHPERFAAIAPVCGGSDPAVLNQADPKKTEAIKSLGIWVFHGAKDTTVPIEQSERMVAALKKFGCKDVEFTVYPELDHNCWTVTYDNPKLYEWLLAHQRK